MAAGRVKRNCQLINVLYYIEVKSHSEVFLVQRGALYWKNLDSTLKTAKSIQAFRFYLKK